MIDADAIADWNSANAFSRSAYLGVIADDDPRHGSVAGYSAHIRDRIRPCEPCRRAQMRYVKKWKLNNVAGVRATLPALGTRRRIQALMRIGWSTNQIADRSGVGLGTVSRVANSERPRVWRSVAAAISETYDALCMTPGPAPVVARRAAARHWPSPLAWDDIDTDPEPKGTRHARR